jgi:hypothetical protein
MIRPLQKISLPADHGPSLPDFQRGWQEASILETFLTAHQTHPTASAETAGAAGAAETETAGATGAANHVTNSQASRIQVRTKKV